MSVKSDPAPSAATVVPSDTDDLPGGIATSLWVGTQGNLTVTMAGGGVVTFVDAIGWMPLQVTRVMATDTDAQGIVACRPLVYGQ